MVAGTFRLVGRLGLLNALTFPFTSLANIQDPLNFYCDVGCLQCRDARVEVGMVPAPLVGGIGKTENLLSYRNKCTLIYLSS